MSALVSGLVWDMPETDVFGRAEKLVLLAYADHADHKGYNIFPSVELISKKTFYKERAVQMTTRKLEELGLLIDDGVGPRGTNRWRIPVVFGTDGGAKIAPHTEISKNAPEGNAPEGNAPEPSVVVKPIHTQAHDFGSMTVNDAYRVKTLQVFRDATNRFPGKPTWEYIDRMVREHSLTVEKIKQVYEVWLRRGYNPENVEGYLEWAVNGIPVRVGQKGQSNGRTNNKPSGGQAVEQETKYSPADREAAERIRAQRARRQPVS